MSQVQLVKQRVCIAIFTVGISLAAFVEIGCSPEQNQMANTQIKQVNHIVVVKS